MTEVNTEKAVATVTRDKKSNIIKRLSSPTFYIATLGSVKLLLDAFGVKIIDDTQINAIANGVSGLVAVIGVALNYE